MSTPASAQSHMGHGRFATTRWSLVCAAGKEDSAAKRALAALCETYWYSLYAFLRRRGCSREEAEDVTQAFFANLLERGWVRSADRDRGRFRTFLLTALTRFLSKERDKATSAKRGGGRTKLSLDFEAGENRYRLEPADEQTPDRLFERRWALTVLDKALARLEGEHSVEPAKAARFAALKPLLTAADDANPYAAVGKALDMTEGAIKVAVHRLRKRYKELLRDEVAQTVSD
ncbi:MAG: sigma-70 family RNA polymerase sigma factor, partial [Planctomycetota bacterium]|nr:sigma-70 family RNA polymerase sigma factor [Planctomycetota bacterium]